MVAQKAPRLVLELSLLWRKIEIHGVPFGLGRV
jgi:hypothetical protein